MHSTKIIAVIGATGAQGGGLVRAIRGDASRRFVARAVTRNPASEAARALGVEAEYADLDNAHSLRQAFDGVHGVFAITPRAASPEQELARIPALAAAAALAGVAHFVWATPGSSRVAEEVFTVAGVPVTTLRTPFFWDRLMHADLAPRRGRDGGLVLTLPLQQKKLPGMAAADVGHCALGVFQAGAAQLGKTLHLAANHLSGHEMADALSRAVGEPVSHRDEPVQSLVDFRPAADDPSNVDATRRLHPGLQSFDQWLARNRKAIHLG